MTNEQDQECFMRLWTISQPSISHYIHALVPDYEAARDILQETALILFRRFGEYDRERPFVAWALGFARFKVMGHRRDTARSLVAFDDELLARFTETWAVLDPQVSARGEVLRKCLERLAAKAREMVQLRYYEDLSAADIAHRLGLNGASVRVTLQRIRDQLRLCVSQQLQLDSPL
jgi:RNA polymerase sigma-70 factor, ECF subfamily